MEVALRELLIEKGVFTPEDVRQEVEAMEGRNAGRGARMVARAWLDPAYKQRLLTNANEAAAELGFEGGPFRILVMENTPAVHNLIVCTLCSCYPRMLLGLPPAWYKSLSYRSRAVREPRAVLAEFGTALPDGRRGPGARQHRRHALHGHADAPARDGRLEQGRARRARD